MTMNFDDMTMTAIWLEIDERLNGEPDPIKGMTLTYSFNLSGEDGGLYGLTLADGKAVTITGDPGEVDCALTMSVKDFKKLLAGNLNSTAAFMMGKLKVKGTIGLALKLEGLLKQYSF
ncbi:SCP2 sterol-binding domain-containing protein [Sporosarcina sp. E16_8]|uniref:SCP2 sterol-binding domain-containing protein n=1 Tax=Sporosarcina sp. E16_8 TaxID=2789295 RepID=UPI001A91647E|nr:SCP2 sterol-binding domain-containing protein [Sporosarcina sp. E16_8]MBO0589580.1 SCP2 sterol-binding domain-containing protein [Sporosarcina sp. E16_8]